MGVLCALSLGYPRIPLYTLSLGYLRVPLYAPSLGYLRVPLHAPSFGYPRVARSDSSRSHRRFLVSAKIALFSYPGFAWYNRFLASERLVLSGSRLRLPGLLKFCAFRSVRIVFYELGLLHCRFCKPGIDLVDPLALVGRFDIDLANECRGPCVSK